MNPLARSRLEAASKCLQLAINDGDANYIWDHLDTMAAALSFLLDPQVTCEMSSLLVSFRRNHDSPRETIKDMITELTREDA